MVSPKKLTKLARGFTLIELLIVIAIIAILAGVVFVSLNPTQRFKDARDASRWTDVTAVLSAVKVHQVDNGGSYLASINALTAGQAYQVSGDNTVLACNTNCSAVTAANRCVDISGLTTGATAYLGAIPVSPNGSGENWTTSLTGYYLTKNSNGSVTVAACSAESGGLVTVTR